MKRLCTPAVLTYNNAAGERELQRRNGAAREARPALSLMPGSRYSSQSTAAGPVPSIGGAEGASKDARPAEPPDATAGATVVAAIGEMVELPSSHGTPLMRCAYPSPADTGVICGQD